MGLGNLFKSVGKAIGKVAASPIGQIGIGLIPGGGAISQIARMGLSQLAAAKAPPMALPGGFSGQNPFKGLGGAFGLIPKGLDVMAERNETGAQKYFRSLVPAHGGGGFSASGRRYRRMNSLNPRAARRAIRRIKSLRKFTQSIESTLPRRKAGCAPRRKVCR